MCGGEWSKVGEKKRGRFGVNITVSCVERRVHKKTEMREDRVCKGKKEEEMGRTCKGIGRE